MAKTYPVKVVVTAEDKASGPISAIGRAVNSSLNGLISKSKALAGGIARTTEFLGNLNQARLLVASAVGAGADFIQGLADTGDELGAFADKTGLSVEAIQAWRYAAERSDVSTETFNSSIEKFAVALEQARAGTGPLAKGLKSISPELLKTLKATTGTEEALGLYIAAMEELPDPAKRALAASVAFGKGNKDMALLAVKGSDAIAKLRAEKIRHGVVTTEEAEQAGKVDDQLKSLKSQYEGIKAAIGGSLLPVLSPLLERLSGWIESNQTLIGLRIEATINEIADAVAWTVKQFTAGVEWVEKYKDEITLAGEVILTLWGVKVVAAFAAAAAAGVSSAATTLAAWAPLIAAGGLLTAAGDEAPVTPERIADEIDTRPELLPNRSTADIAASFGRTQSDAARAELLARGVAPSQIDAIRRASAQSAGVFDLPSQVQRQQAIGTAVGAVTEAPRARAVEDSFFGLSRKTMEQLIKVQIETPPGVRATATATGGGNVTVDTGARQIGTGAP